MREHLASRLTVERLADRGAISPRHFARAFAAETGLTPAKAVERLRLEIARTAVETGDTQLERIAEAAGFGGGRRALQQPEAFRGVRPPLPLPRKGEWCILPSLP
jgi:transcriptional regulator GlxA family with amidase domain